EHVLVVEEDEAVRSFISLLFRQLGFSVTCASSAEGALECLRHSPPDLAVLDLDMSGTSGADICRAIRADGDMSAIPVLILSAGDVEIGRREAFAAGADEYLSKPFDVSELEARAKALIRLKRLQEDRIFVRKAFLSVAKAVEDRDRNASGHSGRVAEMCVRLARELGIKDEADLDMLRLGGLIHDIGKIVVPEAIMHKPGMLFDHEWECVRRHPAAGYELCSPMRRSILALRIVRHHHERLNGAGYPDGLRADDIPLHVRIASAADVLDALLSPRSYREPYPFPKAREILAREASDGLLDRRVVDALLEAVAPRMDALFANCC
ncbi:MAG: response regulator, partial [Planctomycetota bacterium]|nr:response regulator [Planctomycetota bacterium]